VLNTPTLKAMKWWPGGLGKQSTHTLVYANLILDGKEHGFHCFMMQLRDENHRPLPGIEVGEVGPKIGDNGTETGFLRLTNVRIPRKWLLMKNQEVTEDGVYKKRVKKGGGSDKSQYLTMLRIRAGLVISAGFRLAQGVTIATRYSCVRQQGFADTSAEGNRHAQEMTVMDYTNQRYRLLKQLSTAYAFVFAGKGISSAMNNLDDGGGDDLAELHAISSGMKALCTFEGAQGLEDCRKCCGGHGVLLIGGIASEATNYVTYNTAEGDRIVLELQSARFLLRGLRDARAGSTVKGLCEYLNVAASADFNLSRELACSATTPEAFQDLDVLQRLFRGRALCSVLDAATKYDGSVEAGMSHDEAWNLSAYDLVEASRAHCRYTIFSKFVEQVQRIEDGPVRAAMAAVCKLYALISITEELGAFDFNRAQKRAAKDAMLLLLPIVRSDVVPLMDAFEFSDNVLNSALGRHDGRVYESLYAGAKASPLNASDPFNGYEQHLRPHLDLDFIAEHAKVQKDMYVDKPASRSKL